MLAQTEHGTLALDQRDFIEKSWAKWREHAAPGRREDLERSPPTLPARLDLESLCSPQALAANSPTPEQSTQSLFKSCVGDLGWYANRTCKSLLPTYSLLARGLDFSSRGFVTLTLKHSPHRQHTRSPMSHLHLQSWCNTDTAARTDGRRVSHKRIRMHAC